MTYWTNDNGERYNGKEVVVNGIRYYSPSEKKLTALGYHKVVEEVPQVTETEPADKAAEIADLKAQLDSISERLKELEDEP